jgi:hypothetical protein
VAPSLAPIGVTLLHGPSILTTRLWSNPVRCPDPNLQFHVRGVPAMGVVVVKMRLYGPEFWVDMRVTEFDGAWLASADTPDGPTLGRGRSALSAAVNAL